MTKRIWLTTLATLSFLFTIVFGYGLHAQEASPQASPQTSPAASPQASPSPSTVAPVPVSPLPGSATEYTPPSPNPTASPTPTASPLPGGLPAPIFPAPSPEPLPAAKPLPTAGEYRDPAGRFRIAILQDYQVSPIGDAVLAEAKDGSLAYTALAQSANGIVQADQLAKIAKNVFQRGEGFNAGSERQIPGGVQIDWNGSLTIGGNTQPVNGIIVAKSTNTQVLLLLIAATESGGDKVPNAAAALIDSFQVP